MKLDHTTPTASPGSHSATASPDLSLNGFAVPNVSAADLCALLDGQRICLCIDLDALKRSREVPAAVPVETSDRHGYADPVTNLLFAAALRGIPVHYAVF